MVLTVCFDALGTCFTLEPVIKALEEVMGDILPPGVGRMVIMDWVKGITQSITFALQLTTSEYTLPTPIPDLSSVYAQLTNLSPSKGLEEGWKRLKNSHAVVGVITNGSKETTQGYIDQAGLTQLVDVVKSCDEVGKGKPFPEVYTMAHQAIDDVIGEQAKNTERRENKGQGEGQSGVKGEKWFVAAHMWDLNAARKAGFKTGLVLFEQPPIKDGEVDQGWWDIYGGKPDIVGKDIDDVARQIVARH